MGSLFNSESRIRRFIFSVPFLRGQARKRGVYTVYVPPPWSWLSFGARRFGHAELGLQDVWPSRKFNLFSRFPDLRSYTERLGSSFSYYSLLFFFALLKLSMFLTISGGASAVSLALDAFFVCFGFLFCVHACIPSDLFRVQRWIFFLLYLFFFFRSVSFPPAFLSAAAVHATFSLENIRRRAWRSGKFRQLRRTISFLSFFLSLLFLGFLVTFVGLTSGSGNSVFFFPLLIFFFAAEELGVNFSPFFT